MYFGLTYKATNTVNGKTYVGKTTKSLDYRWKRHLWQPIRVFGKAIRKYGPEAFILETLEVLAADTIDGLQSLLNESEKKFIAEFDCQVPKGYNLTAGGDGAVGYKHTPEAQVKMSLAQKGNKKCLGRKRPPHEVEALRQRNLGKKLSTEQIEGMRKRMLGKPGLRKGAVLSQETKDKISASKRGKKRTPEQIARQRASLKANWARRKAINGV